MEGRGPSRRVVLGGLAVGAIGACTPALGSSPYVQDTDYRLLVAFLSRLDNRIVVDVGAEKGSFVEACLDAGSQIADVSLSRIRTNLRADRKIIEERPQRSAAIPSQRGLYLATSQ